MTDQSALSILTAISQVNFSRLAGTRMSPIPDFIGATVDGGGGDNWRYKMCDGAKLQPNGHHQQTITHPFTERMPFLSPNQQCQRTEGERTEGWKNNMTEREGTRCGMTDFSPSPVIFQRC